jgi:NAD+ diphosphatase
MSEAMTAAASDNPFSGAGLDRRSAARAASDWLPAALADTGTRFLLTSGTQHLIRRTPEPAIAFLDSANPLLREIEPQRLVLLGWYQGARCVLIDAPPGCAAGPPGTVLAELRSLLGILPDDQAAILACARALVIWRSRHRHCGACGAPTTPRSAGHSLTCSSSECGAEFFPRIDPAVIVVVTDADRVLLGRQPSWPAGRYSALAGFVEPGETLEDAVLREVHEETGVRASTPRYFASQAWPFPSSLMLGFHATATIGPLKLDGELEAAQWFEARQIAAAAGILLPPHHTIARRLIESWYLRATGSALEAG